VENEPIQGSSRLTQEELDQKLIELDDFYGGYDPAFPEEFPIPRPSNLLEKDKSKQLTTKMSSRPLTMRENLNESVKEKLIDDFNTSESFAELLANTAIGTTKKMGVADFTPAGVAFGIQESIKGYKEASYADDTAGQILSAIGLPLSVVSGLPLTAMGTKGAINLAKKLKVARAKVHGVDFGGTVGNASMVAMTKKTPKSMAMVNKGDKKDFVKDLNLEEAKFKGQMNKSVKDIAERIKGITANIEKTGYFDAYPKGSKYTDKAGKEYTVIGYRASPISPKSKAMLSKLHSERTELIKSGVMPKELTFLDGNNPKFSFNKDVYDDNFYRPMLLAKDKNGKIETFNYDIMLHQKNRKDDLIRKVMPQTDAPKINIMDSTKEVPPLEIGVSKFALDGKLKSNLNKDSIKLFEDKAKGATAGSSKANKLIGVPVKDGEKVGIRKNLNSKSLDGEKGVLQTIHQNNYNGKALSYQPYATVENVIFNVNQSHRRRIASKAKGLAVPESSAKFNMASVDGNYVSNKNLLRDGYETEIAFNPAQGHLFIDVNTGQAVKGAKTATVVGDRVFANGVTYWKKADAPKPLDASDGTKLTGEVRYKFKVGGSVKQKGLMTR
jgi:hypothetical protein